MKIKSVDWIMVKLFDLIYKSNPESLFNKAGVGDSKPVVRQEALAL
jgi:hypothetical protein